jgi:hypothetical protein
MNDSPAPTRLDRLTIGLGIALLAIAVTGIPWLLLGLPHWDAVELTVAIAGFLLGYLVLGKDR